MRLTKRAIYLVAIVILLDVIIPVNLHADQRSEYKYPPIQYNPVPLYLDGNETQIEYREWMPGIAPRNEAIKGNLTVDEPNSTDYYEYPTPIMHNSQCTVDEYALFAYFQIQMNETVVINGTVNITLFAQTDPDPPRFWDTAYGSFSFQLVNRGGVSQYYRMGEATTTPRYFQDGVFRLNAEMEIEEYTFVAGGFLSIELYYCGYGLFNILWGSSDFNSNILVPMNSVQAGFSVANNENEHTLTMKTEIVDVFLIENIESIVLDIYLVEDNFLVASRACNETEIDFFLNETRFIYTWEEWNYSKLLDKNVLRYDIEHKLRITDKIGNIWIYSDIYGLRLKEESELDYSWLLYASVGGILTLIIFIYAGYHNLTRYGYLYKSLPFALLLGRFKNPEREWRRQWSVYKKHQIWSMVLNVIKIDGQINESELARESNMNRSTLRYHLKELVKGEYLISSKERKNRLYSLGPNKYRLDTQPPEITDFDRFLIGVIKTRNITFKELKEIIEEQYKNDGTITETTIKNHLKYLSMLEPPEIIPISGLNPSNLKEIKYVHKTNLPIHLTSVIKEKLNDIISGFDYKKKDLNGLMFEIERKTHLLLHPQDIIDHMTEQHNYKLTYIMKNTKHISCKLCDYKDVTTTHGIPCKRISHQKLPSKYI